MESAGTMRPRDDRDDNGSLTGTGGGGGSVSGTERPSKRQRGLGSGGRGAGYSPPEVSFFLSLLEEHLPVTNKEWKAVVRLHNSQFPSLKRTSNSLRRKFSSLCRSTSPGADELSLPAEVRRAVHAKRRMKNRGDVPEDDDDLPDSDDEDGENDDDFHSGSQQRRRESAGDGVAMQSAAAAAAHAAPATAQGPQALTPRYYSNGQATAAMSVPIPAQSQSQFNNNNNVGSRAQAMYDRLSDVASDRRGGVANGNVTQADLIELIKLQLLQNVEDDRCRRQEETERREEERRHREQERATRDEFRRRCEEERARREQDLRRWEQEREESRHRHEEFMQIILSLLNKNADRHLLRSQLEVAAEMEEAPVAWVADDTDIPPTGSNDTNRETMQALEDDGRRVLKRQRACADQINHQLDLFLTEVETAKAQLVEKRDEYKRKRQRSQAAEESAETAGGEREETRESENTPDAANASDLSRDVEKGDDEMEHIVQEFVDRVKMLNLDKAAADELKGLHIALAKYGKQIDKLSSSDITKICRSKEPDHQAVCQLIAEYLYHDGQIAAADALCVEAGIELPSHYRSCFVELFHMTDALKEKNMVPALEWSRRHREELQHLHIDIEFELVRLKYLDLLETCSDVMDAVKLAGEELSPFHATHKSDIGRLMTCVIYKQNFSQSPYKDLFDPNRWDHIRQGVVRACCRLNNVPHRAYLDTCLSAGVTALPAMRKLVNVMDSKLANWDSMEELPVEIPVANEHRFHTVFSCPVSKEESTPTNPPMLLKCGHVICKSCVKKISLNMTRRFKCPTCPMEQTESETHELFF